MTTVPRNYMKVYDNKNQSRRAKVINFKIGEKVLARKGARAKFTTPAVILRNLGRGTYLIETSIGTRVYNQANLTRAPAFFPDWQQMELEDSAYASVQVPTIPVQSPDAATGSPESRYNLRPRHSVRKPDYFKPA